MIPGSWRPQHYTRRWEGGGASGTRIDPALELFYGGCSTPVLLSGDKGSYAVLCPRRKGPDKFILICSGALPVCSSPGFRFRRLPRMKEPTYLTYKLNFRRHLLQIASTTSH